MKFYCLDIDYRSVDKTFELSPLESTTEDEAWEEIEEGYATNMSTSILLSEEQRIALIKVLEG